MTDGDNAPRYRANPVVVAELPDGVLLKRGSIEVRITGSGSAEVISTLMDELGEHARTREELLNRFPKVMQETVNTLIDQLVDRRLLESADTSIEPQSVMESPLDIFFWEHGFDKAQWVEQATKRSFVILGINFVSMAVCRALISGGIKLIKVLDVPALRNIRFFDDIGGDLLPDWQRDLPVPISIDEFLADEDDFDCMIGTSDFGGMHLLRQWNEFAVEANRAFFPVILQNMMGYLGPLVIPGETACFECYRARQNSHMADPSSQRAAEITAHEAQLGASFHPAMAAALGNLAALEITKFFVGRIAGWQVGTVIEMDLLKPEMNVRRVLRVPRCKVCDAGNKQSAVSLDEKLFIPHQIRSA